MCKRRQLGLAAPRAVVVRVLRISATPHVQNRLRTEWMPALVIYPVRGATIARSTESSPRLTALTISAWSASGLISVGTREPSRCAL